MTEIVETSNADRQVAIVVPSLVDIRHGLSHDIACYGDYVFTAEKSAGLGIYHCPALATDTP